MGISASRQFNDEVAACVKEGIGQENFLTNPDVVFQHNTLYPRR